MIWTSSFSRSAATKPCHSRHHIIHVIDTGDKCLNELLLAPQFGAGIHRLLDGNKDFLIITVGIVVLLYQHQDIINVDLDLADQLNFKDDIIGNVLFLAFCTVYPLVPQILVAAQIVLQIPFGDDFLAF